MREPKPKHKPYEVAIDAVSDLLAARCVRQATYASQCAELAAIRGRLHATLHVHLGLEPDDEVVRRSADSVEVSVFVGYRLPSGEASIVVYRELGDRGLERLMRVTADQLGCEVLLDPLDVIGNTAGLPDFEEKLMSLLLETILISSDEFLDARQAVIDARPGIVNHESTKEKT